MAPDKITAYTTTTATTATFTTTHIAHRFLRGDQQFLELLAKCDMFAVKSQHSKDKELKITRPALIHNTFISINYYY